jgi:hypothetical protein
MFRGHDMPRARKLLDGMRSDARDQIGVPVEASIYNQFIVAYFDLAIAAEDAYKRQSYVQEAWAIFDNMQTDLVAPDLNAFANILLILTRFAIRL